VTRGRPDAVLLDRDGTINVKAPDGDYVTEPEQLTLLPGAAAAIRTINLAGVPVVVITNQRGIALGRMTTGTLRAVHARLCELLGHHAAWIDQIFYCPHDKGMCCCRKPGTLMLERARAHLDLDDLHGSVMIGDSASDVLAGRAAGARTVLLGTAEAACDGDDVAGSLLDALPLILGDDTLASLGRSDTRGR
jgi:D-glycero-D-manno-heptose 1,7-bisphosphate phosphatase